MGHIFLSDAREDRASVERLARLLDEHGHDVWWDHRIDGGEEFGAEIEAALEKSDVVLVASVDGSSPTLHSSTRFSAPC